MATRRKNTARKTKSKGSQPRSKPHRKSVVRATSSKREKGSKKRLSKTTRKRASRRPQALRRSQGTAPVLQDTIVDIVDESLPGIVRVTEIEEVGVAMPDEEDGD